MDWFELQVSESESEVTEFRKIKVKEKGGQGESSKGQIDQSVKTPSKSRTGNVNSPGSQNRKQTVEVDGNLSDDEKNRRQTKVNGSLSDDENIAEDDLDKMLLDKAIRTGPNRKGRRRTRTMDNNNIVAGNGARNMDSNNNNSAENDKETKTKIPQKSNPRSQSDSEVASGGKNQSHKTPERQRKTPVKDSNNVKANCAVRNTPVKNNKNTPKTGTPGKGTPAKNKNNSSNAVTKETNNVVTVAGDVNDNDNDDEFRSCASSPQQLAAAQPVPQPQNRSSPGTVAPQSKSSSAGTGKAGKKKLMSRSPELFDEETRLPANKRHSRESVSLTSSLFSMSLVSMNLGSK